MSVNSVSLREVFTGLRFFTCLLPFFRHPMERQEGKRILQDRIQNRAAYFHFNLIVVERGILRATASGKILHLHHQQGT